MCKATLNNLGVDLCDPQRESTTSRVNMDSAYWIAMAIVVLFLGSAMMVYVYRKQTGRHDWFPFY